MAQKDVRTLAEKRVSYVEKNAYLMDMLGDSVPCRDFYRDIFPSGFLQDAYRANPGAPHDGKYVAIANAIHERRKDGRPYRRNHYVTDDLGMLARLSHLVAFPARIWAARRTSRTCAISTPSWWTSTTWTFRSSTTSCTSRSSATYPHRPTSSTPARDCIFTTSSRSR